MTSPICTPPHPHPNNTDFHGQLTGCETRDHLGCNHGSLVVPSTAAEAEVEEAEEQAYRQSRDHQHPSRPDEI